MAAGGEAKGTGYAVARLVSEEQYFFAKASSTIERVA